MLIPPPPATARPSSFLPPSFLPTEQACKDNPQRKKSKGTRGTQGAHSAAVAVWRRARGCGVCGGRLEGGWGFRDIWNASAADAVLSRRGQALLLRTRTGTHTQHHTPTHTQSTQTPQGAGGQVHVCRVSPARQARRRCRTRLSWADEGVSSSTCLGHHDHPQARDKGAGRVMARLRRL